MRTATGQSTEAIYIFNNMLRKLAKSFSPPYIAAIFESSAPTIRSQESPSAKANRVETAHDLLDQVPHGAPCPRACCRRRRWSSGGNAADRSGDTRAKTFG